MIHLSFLGVIHKIFQLELAIPKHDLLCKAKLAGKNVRKSYLRPHAACGYRVKLQRQGYTEQRTPDNIYIHINIYIKNRNRTD